MLDAQHRKERINNAQKDDLLQSLEYNATGNIRNDAGRHRTSRLDDNEKIGLSNQRSRPQRLKIPDNY